MFFSAFSVASVSSCSVFISCSTPERNLKLLQEQTEETERTENQNFPSSCIPSFILSFPRYLRSQIANRRSASHGLQYTGNRPDFARDENNRSCRVRNRQRARWAVHGMHDLR